MGFLSGMLGLDAGKATMQAAKQNKNILGQFQRAGNSIINKGEAKSSGALNQAAGNYDPYLATGAGATTMYGNALGLNGADGTAAAQGAFQAGPGYNFALEQGTNAALRGASAAGMLNSGNTLTALSEYGQGLANQEYGGWLDRLSGAANQGLSAASGQGSALGGLANLYQSTAGDRLGLESAVAQGRMGVNNQNASGREANKAAGAGFFGNLLGAGTKLISGGLF
ncbi:hypothetical protein U8C35_07805 [Sinorhizobium medicae]|uniref:hypothetical protein n=1 Tax=Sinorhizobium medicae TaxID=110321 RepID=UPI002AF6BF64|nr:hypothetical protein [Sinorhizobium medicae]WQO60316.1 hypothetical protein U8C35_07805 [Sinorhizobium medicae]